MKLAMGQYDAPLIQEQPVFRLDPHRSNIAVFGGPMSGKTTFIKTLLVRIHENLDRAPRENVYIIDFGGNLGEYSKLPGVCACFDNSNEENIKRVFRTVEKRLEENARALDSRSYYQVVSKNPEDAPDHLFLIIENINAFLADERYSSYQDRLVRFCRDGLTKGLTVVITANETTGINRILANFGQKVAFEMPGDSYFDIFGAKVIRPMRHPGRGLVNIDSTVYEFQCFLPFPATEDEAHLQALMEKTAHFSNENILAAFDEFLDRENFHRFCAAGETCPEDQVTVGLDYHEHKPVSVDIDRHRCIAIYGKRQFGKTNLLQLLLEGIRSQRPDARFVYFDDGRKQLLPFYMPGPGRISENAEYLTDLTAMRDYLTDNGYGGVRREGVAPGQPRMVEAGETPFTVFVLQSKLLFRISSNHAVYLMSKGFPGMIADADAKGYLFIFSDVPTISESSITAPLNDNISYAFLLDNIGEFVAEKGHGARSVFGEMDAREMKAEYARCSIGDGYAYDTEADTLQKVKFIKAQ